MRSGVSLFDWNFWAANRCQGALVYKNLELNIL
jgi:hypothetical protein